MEDYTECPDCQSEDIGKSLKTELWYCNACQNNWPKDSKTWPPEAE